MSSCELLLVACSIAVIVAGLVVVVAAGVVVAAVVVVVVCCCSPLPFPTGSFSFFSPRCGWHCSHWYKKGIGLNIKSSGSIVRDRVCLLRVVSDPRFFLSLVFASYTYRATSGKERTGVGGGGVMMKQVQGELRSMKVRAGVHDCNVTVDIPLKVTQMYPKSCSS